MVALDLYDLEVRLEALDSYDLGVRLETLGSNLTHMILKNYMQMI